jgi:hypothetical protein
MPTVISVITGRASVGGTIRIRIGDVISGCCQTVESGATASG